jgi:hypothetical protein
MEGPLKQFDAVRSFCAAALVLAFSCVVARADADIDRWRFGEAGDGLVLTSLNATNKLMTAGGVLSYSPTLTIACRSAGEPRWTEWLQLNDAVSARKTITVAVAIGEGDGFEETWSVDGRGKMLVRDGETAVQRLLSADRLRLSWRFGLLAGRGEADFDLTGADRALRRIAEACKTDLP